MIKTETVLERKRLGESLCREAPKRLAPDLRIAVLCSFNIDSLSAFLAEALHRTGFRSESWFGPFGQISEQILPIDSNLHAFSPNIVTLIAAAEDLLAPIYRRPASFSAREATEFVHARVSELRSGIELLLERNPEATVFIVPFGTERLPAAHILSATAAERGQQLLTEFVESVRRLEEISPRVVTVDWDWHARRAGWAGYRDERLWYLARMRLNLTGLAALADLLAHYYVALRKGPLKVVVVDLDNTLWGGVVGEAGWENLMLGDEGIGFAFQEFQRELLKLTDSGTLLAACSKNNPEDALAVFEQHQGMVLRREHFACMRINWEDKATNIREIARELNLGLDSFVFLDDNPVERAWVAKAIPEVLVPELPEDPVDRPAFLREFPRLQRIRVTESDRSRTHSYQTSQLRTELRTKIADYDEFLCSLQQVIHIAPLSPAHLARAVQMLQRTSQFNLTTRHYSEAEVEAFIRSEDYELFTLAVRDRFEDSGIVGLAILNYRDGKAEVASLLLSCRALGRRVEDALLAFLVQRAKQRGATELLGRYIATAKNNQVKNFYLDRHFEPAGDGLFVLPLSSGQPGPEFPAHAKLELPNG